MYTTSPATTGRPKASFPNSALHAMLRPLWISQSTGGLPIVSIVAGGFMEPGSPIETADAIGFAVISPLIRCSAH